ncbi:MAG: alkaline phosphatase D family protein [Kyrpidia tusciae]|nr:alkaline phosphatase D family protein [Kyrpidia tusciae]MBE3551895.1 alkaline phosphatase D family protein [Kyrpidia tusciae]
MDATRRAFLKALLAGSAYILTETLGISKLVRAAEATQETDLGFRPQYTPGFGFPQSVASGDPTSTGAILWTRVDPAAAQGVSATNFDPKMIQWIAGNQTTDLPTSVISAIQSGQFVEFQVGTDPELRQGVLRGYAPIYKDFDNVVKVDLDGRLLPKRTYYYRFVTQEGHVSRTGRFKTLAPENETPSSLRIGQVTCADYTNGYYHAYRLLAQEDVDFVLHLGDYIYESVGDTNYQNPLPDRTIRLSGGKLKAQTAEDYRTLYRTYRSDPDLQALHERHAMVAIWDDHEFANDCYADVAPDDTTSPDAGRRRIANQVWFEYMPARVLFDPGQDFQHSLRMYRSIKIGHLAELLLTDERLYRSPHPCGEKVVGQRYFTLGCPKMFSSSQSMLGAGVSDQRGWFMDRLTHSTAVWKLWANEVQFTQLKLLGFYLNLDAWDGYSGERAWLLSQIQQAGVKNFVALTGDLHTFEANIIPSNFHLLPQGKPIGIELMTGSITSSNLKEMVEQALFGRPASSCPLPKEVAQELVKHLLSPAQQWTEKSISEFIDKFTGILHVENPWIKWFESTQHGYCILDISPSRLTWSAYSAGDIRSRSGANKRLLYQCEVPEGKASLEVLVHAQ